MNYNEMYELSREGSLRSARVVVPLLCRIIEPSSVVDVGCGHGWWLSVFKEQGCQVRGVDGAHVDRSRLVIERGEFEVADLSTPCASWVRADLATSFEVAEHLPERAARGFVRMLTDSALVVAFSAAMPHQGGVNHVNEQWPRYWWDLFAERGYRGTGALRWALWGNTEVEHWYQQIFLYAREDAIEANPHLRAYMESPLAPPWPVVHPVLWESRT